MDAWRCLYFSFFLLFSGLLHGCIGNFGHGRQVECVLSAGKWIEHLICRFF